MARPRELRRRIRSVENTKKITRTMEMVSTSKLKRAQDRVVSARPYAAALRDLLADLYAPELADRFPLFRQPPKEGLRRVALIAITSNRGLCGAFNANLIRETRRRLADYEQRKVAVDLHLVGKKGINYFRYVGRTAASQRLDIGDRPTPRHAVELVEPLVRQFEGGELDAVEVVYAHFKSAVSTPPETMRILPITPPAQAVGRSGGRAVSILKPSAEGILQALIPLYVRNEMYRALVETAAAEHGARRTAMKNATDSAGDMIDLLRRTYNRARQAQITQELAEIVGGAEALKG